MWGAGARKDDDDDDSSEEDSEEDSEEESGDDADKAGSSKLDAELSREERKKQKAAQKAAAIAKKSKAAVQVGDLPSDSEEEESDDDMPANPNHSKAARNLTKAPPKPVEEVTEGVKNLSTAGMNRRERESMEAQQAKERYRKLHEAGKTDEAKADMARLRLIREKREAEAARRQVRIPAAYPRDHRRDADIRDLGREGGEGCPGGDPEKGDRDQGGEEARGCAGQARQEGQGQLTAPHTPAHALLDTP